MANNILRKLAEANEQQEEEKKIVNEDISDGKLTAFRYNNKLYYYAVREDVLIFDHHKELFYTISMEELRNTEHPFFQKVYSLVCNLNEDKVKLFVNRNGIFESISFTSRFDAIFIFKKLKRVASREIENIDEVLIEKNGILIDSFKPNEKRQRFYMNFKGLRNRVVDKKSNNVKIENSPQVETLVKVEETIDSIIGASIVNEEVEIENEKLDKCIELLNSLKN